MTCTTKDIKAIIFGEGNYNSLGVLHQLHAAQIPSLILNIGDPRSVSKGNIIGYSKKCRNIVKVNSAEEGVSWLLANIQEFEKGTVIYPTSDEVIKILDQNFKDLYPHFLFPNAGPNGHLSKLLNKNFQTELATTHGLRTIKSIYTDVAGFNTAYVEYPCMVKTLNSTVGNKGDMAVCESPEQLAKIIAESPRKDKLIIQKYIRNEADMLFLGISYPNGEIEIPAVVIKPGVSPIGEYSHALISTDINRHLEEKNQVIEFVKSTHYTGPFSIEFGTENGKKYFFEINLRNDGTSHYPLKAGVNIAEAYILDKRIGAKKSIEYEMIDEVGDIRRVLYHELTFFQWLKSLIKAGSYKWYVPGDYTLLFPLTRMLLKRIAAKLITSSIIDD